MNKLGFAIKLASQGAGNAIECNKGQWTSKVVDIREYLKLFNGLQGTDNIVTFMSFDEGGCFLTQLRAISGRMGDFLSGWIYIPNTIEVTGDDVMNTYNYVRNILSQSNLNDSIEDIEKFFSKEYPNQEYVAQYIPSSGEEFGVRFIDVYYNMKEILDSDRYQPYYSNFRAIFLLDKNSEVKIAKEQVARFKDLTKFNIEKTCIFNAPSPEEVRLLGKGTKIFFSNKREFNSSVLTKKGDKIQLFAYREGFEPFTLPIVTIQENVQECTIDHRIVKWKKRISHSMFTVFNSQRERIDGVLISVNGVDIPTHQDLILGADDCRQATVKYSAPDYESFEERRNLLLNDYHEVVLKRKVKSYQATVELANGKFAEMTLESKYLPANYDSPLFGYDFDEEYGGKKVLRMSSGFVWKQRLWGILAALAVIMAIVAFKAFDSWVDTHKFKFGLPPWEETRPAQQYTPDNSFESDEIAQDQTNNQSDFGIQDTVDTSIEAAIKYLDNNDVWVKSEMEKYPDLKGLYDDMNSFELKVILEDWHRKLKESQNFKDICKSAQKTLDHNWNPKQGSHKPTYNQQNDEQINVTNYKNWLDNDQTPRSSSGEGNNRSKIDTKGGNNRNNASSSSSTSRNSSTQQTTVNGDNSRNGGL